MTKEQDFLQRWQSERGIYLAWGEHISTTISAALEPVVAPAAVSYFLKAAPIPRLKEDLTLVSKAFYRNKPYRDPYEEITDKVGARFVVLLGSHVRQVAAVQRDIVRLPRLH